MFRFAYLYKNDDPFLVSTESTQIVPPGQTKHFLLFSLGIPRMNTPFQLPRNNGSRRAYHTSPSSGHATDWPSPRSAAHAACSPGSLAYGAGCPGTHATSPLYSFNDTTASKFCPFARSHETTLAPALGGQTYVLLTLFRLISVWLSI